ncbi:hypothetical protein, partial [Rhodoferax sp.]|uniref:hypothetical protein n=1 Tax=Rhodoferax sp. TaxID=50421 RepID=UPI0027160D36
MRPTARITAPIIFTLGLLAGSQCLAGRPLAVDDANVNEVGAGHVEAWYARQPDGANVWTVAPAYGLTEGMEIAASWARDASNQVNTTALQAKFRLTPSLKDGCNVGLAIGASRPNDGNGNTPYINGLLSCNMDAGSLHFNLGANRPPDGPALNTWGLAFEHEFGAMTAHVEYFGQEQASPTLQLGLRTELVKNVQIDGTVGHASGDALFSLGL